MPATPRLGLMAALTAALTVGWTLLAMPAAAHFQELIPEADVLPEGGDVTLEMVFTHPVDGGPVMPMDTPRRFGVVAGGETVDLLDSLEPRPIDGVPTWTATHALPEPGAAVFFVEPAPYWEPAEGKFIIHYTKVVVDSWASGEGWDTMVGLPVEIEPLVRPTGLWTGNTFRGVVLKDGEPVPHAEVEVEFINDGRVDPPNDAFVTQVIKADAHGVFAYTMPLAGWWGFAALTEADQTMTAPDGQEAPIEAGALMWVKTTDMPRVGQ
ncbi:DUF4198 domain-containing protein [uncultured Rhodospira sp.]|uniref:DUF4198 domain-containing protein n=1 Tax=uncultured Rhodospira sp. TaxID=1936189 RepID=UPI00260C2E5E|nr:DUF4198 domain-containing protein [uncultured Rhodospira sp.]